MRNCWSYHPDDRPNFQEIVGSLTQIYLLMVMDKQTEYANTKTTLFSTAQRP